MLAPATLAALPSTRAIPDRDVFYAWHAVALAKVGRFPQKLHSLDRDVFYAARILWLSSVNLSLARVRRQKNH